MQKQKLPMMILAYMMDRRILHSEQSAAHLYVGDTPCFRYGNESTTQTSLLQQAKKGR